MAHGHARELLLDYVKMTKLMKWMRAERYMQREGRLCLNAVDVLHFRIFRLSSGTVERWHRKHTSKCIFENTCLYIVCIRDAHV